jgi:hypothetical protein
MIIQNLKHKIYVISIVRNLNITFIFIRTKRIYDNFYNNYKIIRIIRRKVWINTITKSINNINPILTEELKHNNNKE